MVFVTYADDEKKMFAGVRVRLVADRRANRSAWNKHKAKKARSTSITIMTMTTRDHKQASSPVDVVRIPYDKLITTFQLGRTHENATAIHELIEEAFSSSGLGIIAITDVPNLSKLRLQLLPLALKLATLSPDQLEEIIVPESDYQVGWVSSKFSDSKANL